MHLVAPIYLSVRLSVLSCAAKSNKSHLVWMLGLVFDVTISRGLLRFRLFLVLSNQTNYQSMVFICVSVIRGRIRKIVQMWSISFSKFFRSI